MTTATEQSNTLPNQRICIISRHLSGRRSVHRTVRDIFKRGGCWEGWFTYQGERWHAWRCFPSGEWSSPGRLNDAGWWNRGVA